jgi:hypothetical protein
MDFTNWLHSRLQKMPECDKLHLLIQAAGPNGIPEGELRSQVDLPMKLFDQLVQSMVGAGLVKVVGRGEERVYLAR